MKAFPKLILVIIFTVFAAPLVSACEIEFKISDKKDSIYTVGDELIIAVEVVFTHRVCPIALKETSFKYQGIKVLGATPWKESSPMRYTRKIKVKIAPDKKHISKITAIRSCDKEGGFGSLVIPRTK